jgi:hypothetical protein
MNALADTDNDQSMDDNKIPLAGGFYPRISSRISLNVLSNRHCRQTIVYDTTM